TYTGGGSWSDIGTQDATMTIYIHKSVDDDAGTAAQTNSEANPWIRLDLSSIADKEPSAIALHPHANTNATQIKIQTSPDGAAWTDKRLINVSALTMGAYNYIRFNRDTEPMRYLRIYVLDAAAKVLALNEVKVLIPATTDWNAKHGHKTIDATDANLGLSG
ncbi:MAG: discoidin domain-containing protein, partial [Nitrososphaera sp.]